MKRVPAAASLTILACFVACCLPQAASARRHASPTPTPTLADTAPAPESAPAPSNAPADVPQGILFPYSILDDALTGRVNHSGAIDFSALKGNKSLAEFVRDTATADLSQFPVFTVAPPKPDPDADVKPPPAAHPTQDRSAETVFWINAYNAHMLKTISDAFPVGSTEDIPDFDTAKTHLIANRYWSFKELRDKIEAMDRRAIFALSDGTKGGALLAPNAYRFDDINARLDNAVSSFVNDPRKVQVLRIDNVVTVAPLLADADALFRPTNARSKWDGIRYLLQMYSSGAGDRDYYTTADYRIEFLPFDHGLYDKMG